VLGVVAIISIQRAIQKILIAVFLTRGFKHDETNRAWWTGKWYGRGLGNSAMSQPAQEFIVKVVEMSLWSSDFLLGHILLIIFDSFDSYSICEFLAFHAAAYVSLFLVYLGF
jgi:1,3-beta-glucan synthase